MNISAPFVINRFIFQDIEYFLNGKTPAAQSTMDQLSAIHQLTPLKGQTGEFNNTDHPDTIQWSWWETLEPGIHVDDS